MSNLAIKRVNHLSDHITVYSRTISCSVGELKELRLIKIERGDTYLSNSWKDMMNEYHYLGSPLRIGAEIRYLISSEFGLLGGLGFSSPAWRCGDRDQWIGWENKERERNLQKIVNNSRFLILPYVRVRNLASKVLSMSANRIRQDWQERYEKKIILLETFVDKQFSGTSYQAANWERVGQTKGRGKWDSKHKKPLPLKDIYVYPLIKKAQKKLGGRVKKKEKEETDWVVNEFQKFNPGDKRLQQRLYLLGKDFFAHPEANIPQACNSRSKTKAAYRFFKHEDVTMAGMLDSHYEATVKRMKEEKVVLAVQDTTSLNYSGHSTSELGYIGVSIKNRGIMVHDTMSFDTTGIPFGLLDLQTWERDPKEHGKKKKRKQLPIEAKESYKWLRSFKALIPIQQQLKKTMLVSVGDREADIFELFQLADQTEKGPKLLIRASQNRILKNEQGKLWEKMQNCPKSGQLTIKVPRKAGQKKREATLDIHFSLVELTGKRREGSLKIWAIYANESNPPKGIEPLSWLLLTTLEINSFEDAVEKLKWYAIRWQIEIYHKIIKSGCRIENRQIFNLKSLKACFAVDLVVAWRIHYLTKLSRKFPDIPCTVNFEDYEWKALYSYANKTKQLPSKVPTLKEAVHMVASLGGFLGRKSDGNPGPITIWRGLITLSTIAKSYLLFSNLSASVRGQPTYG